MDGTPFGRYRLIALLGRGGMGEVWRAFDTATNRTVAIKVLPAQLGQEDTFAQRFRREAEAAARLNSPHIVPIHDYGEIDGRLFVNMRLIEGRDLQTVLAEGPLEPARAVHIIEQVAKALHAAHRVGLIHRDIKPSNILLGDDDFAYLIDFGIARTADETRMTKAGHMIGTFAYLAPERLDSTREEDARADIYALACVLYETLTGQPPFAGTTPAHLIAAHLNAPPPRPSTVRPGLPSTVDAVIATGMAKEPDQRYATTIELAGAARTAITAPVQRSVPPSYLPPTVQAPQPPAQRASGWTAPVAAAPPAPAWPVSRPRPASPSVADEPQGLRDALEPIPTRGNVADRAKQRRANAITLAVIVTVLLLVVLLIVGVVVTHAKLYKSAAGGPQVGVSLPVNAAWDPGQAFAHASQPADYQ